MECPVCGEKLREIQKYGVEVDICPGCKGVWLDKGELEKILELADAGGPAVAREEDHPRTDDRGYGDNRRHDDDRRYDDTRRPVAYPDDYRPHKRRKKGGWLGDLFEGFGED